MEEDIYKKSLIIHQQVKGKIGIRTKLEVDNKEDLSIAYTPGVAEPCRVIAQDDTQTWNLTLKRNSVAVVSDGSAVLGLGNIGANASIPVMEGKALLFRKYARIDAWPICLDTQDPDEIIRTVRNIAPVFGGINLEDISAPNCFRIEEELQDLGIPVFHDDQHGTAIVLFAALLNAAKVVGKNFSDLKVVINGAGAAGTAIAKLLCGFNNETQTDRVADVVVCDSKGAIHRNRDGLNQEKKKLLEFTNKNDVEGKLQEAIQGMDVFIGVSKGDLLTAEDIKHMANDAIILAMANPIPEIMPEEAMKGGATVVGTGRSDFPNQVNNVLAFPGIFRGALNARASKITQDMKIAAAYALADAVRNPRPEKIIPDPFDITVTPLVAKAVAEAYQP